MLKVTSFEKTSDYSKFTVDKGDGVGYVWILRDGILEQYMEAYQMQAGECFLMLLLDAMDDSVFIPQSDESGARETIAYLMKQADEVEWVSDKDEILAQVTLANDSASEVAKTWRIQRQAQEALATSHQRRQEEILGDEMVGELVAERNRNVIQTSDGWERYK